jgi:peptidoglycan hydrolase CwlO-like protein
MLRNFVKRTVVQTKTPNFVACYSRSHGAAEKQLEDEYIQRKEHEEKLRHLHEAQTKQGNDTHEIKKSVQTHVEKSNSKIDELTAQIEALKQEVAKLKK